MEKSLIDNLTGIYNEEYLKSNYQKYIIQYPNSNFIMIDFEKFKKINDTFGHNVGDDYLKVFAKILENIFNSSIVVRLHGDEFAILTKYDEEEISKRFELCNRKILLAVHEGKIPQVFGYNAGSTKAEHGINNTKEKADFMMYHAKENNKNYQKFSLAILQQKIYQDDFLNKIDENLKYEQFSYTTRQLFNKEEIGQRIYQIYTKNIDYSSIFDNGRYDILKRTSKLPNFDIYNIQNLLERVDYTQNKIIITIDYKSLIYNFNLLEYLILLKDVSNLNFHNVILNIDLVGIEPINYKYIINKITELKKIGFNIRLDKFDSKIGDELWEKAVVDYIKISNSYWKESMNDSKLRFLLKIKSKMYSDYGMIPIFEYIENDKEYNFLKEVTPDNSLFSGDYLAKEKKLVLK